MSIPPGWKRVPERSVLLTGRVDFLREGETYVRNRPLTHDAVQRSFWSQVVSRTWTESPTRGKLIEDYRLEVLGTGFESRYRLWCKKPKKALFSTFFRACPCGKCGRRGFRVDPGKARDWLPPAREPLFWAPRREVEEPTEESWNVTVDELVEYEPLLFSPPRGAEGSFDGVDGLRTVELRADYTKLDHSSSIFYR